MADGFVHRSHSTRPQHRSLYFCLAGLVAKQRSEQLELISLLLAFIMARVLQCLQLLGERLDPGFRDFLQVDFPSI